MQETIATLKDSLEKEEEAKRQLDEGSERLQKETQDLLAQLEATKGSNTVSLTSSENVLKY